MNTWIKTHNSTYILSPRPMGVFVVRSTNRTYRGPYRMVLGLWPVVGQSMVLTFLGGKRVGRVLITSPVQSIEERA